VRVRACIGTLLKKSEAGIPVSLYVTTIQTFYADACSQFQFGLDSMVADSTPCQLRAQSMLLN
jgi:hypothetical protein